MNILVGLVTIAQQMVIALSDLEPVALNAGKGLEGRPCSTSAVLTMTDE